MRERCKECGELIGAVITATCSAQDAQLKLDAVAKGQSTRKQVAALYKARVEERRALTALDKHLKEHGSFLVGAKRASGRSI